jgi:hypothetical protein
VTLSTAVIVTCPIYLLAVNPESETPMLVVEDAVRLTLPDAGVVLIQAALGVAFQFKG